MGTAARRSGPTGYAAFGVAYTLASLRCTLPVFLTVVGSALVLHGFAAGLLEFALYGLRMGVVMAALTLAVALLRRGALAAAGPALGESCQRGAAAGHRYLRRLHWLTLGGLIDRL